MRNVVLIENQWTQFNQIKSELEYGQDEFKIYPESERKYKQFIDWIRIILNKRYDKERIYLYLEKVKTELISIEADILIIDHILVGCHDGLTGIDLAIELRKTFSIIPILFLSKSEFNSYNVCIKYPEVKPPCEWIPKTIKGHNTADCDHFKLLKERISHYLKQIEQHDLREIIIEFLEENKPHYNDGENLEFKQEIIDISDKVIELLESGIIIASEELIEKITTVRDNGFTKYCNYLKTLIQFDIKHDSKL